MVLDYVVQHVDEISLPVLVHYSANYLDWRFKYAQKINDKIHNLFKRKDWMHDVDLGAESIENGLLLNVLLFDLHRMRDAVVIQLSNNIIECGAMQS